MFTDEEFSNIVNAADNGPVVLRTPFLDRSMLCFVVAYTGLRARELAGVEIPEKTGVLAPGSIETNRIT